MGYQGLEEAGMEALVAAGEKVDQAKAGLEWAEKTEAGLVANWEGAVAVVAGLTAVVGTVMAKAATGTALEKVATDEFAHPKVQHPMTRTGKHCSRPGLLWNGWPRCQKSRRPPHCEHM